MALKILSLIVENFKKIRAVEIHPTGPTVTIAGKNRQGKSSVLDAIMVAFAGNKYLPEKPIREGAERATIQIDCGDFVLEKRISKAGATLKIESKDGAIKSPQAFLDKILGEISFDPLDFIRKEPRQQRAVLISLTGSDTAEIDAEIKRLKDIDRPAIGREVDRLKAQRDSAIFTPDLPDEEISSAEILAQIDAVAAHNKTVDELEGKIAKIDEWIEGSPERCKELNAQARSYEAEINRLKELLKGIDNKIEQEESNLAKANQVRAKHCLDLADKPRRDETPLRTELAGLAEKNKKIAANKAHASAAANFKAKEKEYAGLTRKIEDLEAKKTAIIRDAKMPIDGLSFGEDCLLYNRIPLSQVSDSEKIKIGIAIAMKLNPILRVIRITDGSLLDSDTMADINKMIAAEDFQLWIEKVEDGGKVGIIIEDGSIKEE